MKKLVFATNNAHKLSEVKAILSDYEIVSLSDINCFDDIPETADTLEGNAQIKASYIFEKYGLDCFADDTGLEVDALGGEPGVFSARYAGDDHNSHNNMMKLLDKLGDNPHRDAHFRTVIALIEGGKIQYFEGRIDGKIAHSPRGKAGFGYDPVFVPSFYNQSFAELGTDEKNKISHRALAVQKLAAYLQGK